MLADSKAQGLRVFDDTTYLAEDAKASRELGLDHRPFEEGLRKTLDAETWEFGMEAPAADRV